MADENPAFETWPAHLQHRYLKETEPDYARMSSQDQAGYLAHVRGEVMPQAAERGAGGVPKPGQKIYMGNEPPVDMRSYAADRGVALASAPTVGMGPLAGAATRTGLSMAEPWLAGHGSALASGLRGGVNAVLEALPYGVGKGIRSFPGVEGMLKRRIGAETAARQAGMDETADVANRMVQGTFKSQEAARKAEADAAAEAANQTATAGWRDAKTQAKGVADETNAASLQNWMLARRGAREAREVQKRTDAATAAVNKSTMETAEGDLNSTLGEKVRSVAANQVPAARLDSRRQFHDYAWGEHGMSGVKNAMDEGQATIVKQIRGQQLRLPSMARPGEATMPFEEAWLRAGQMRGQARDAAFDEIFQELRRLNPSGAASGMFAQLRDHYNMAKTWQAAGRAGVEPTGGGYDMSKLAAWWNKRRDVLQRRMGPDRYEEASNALFNRPTAGGEIPPARAQLLESPPINVPTVPPRPSRVTPEYPPRPANVPSDFTPGPRPERIPGETAIPSATVQSVPPMAKALLPSSYLLLPNLFSRWSGKVPFSPRPQDQMAPMMLERMLDEALRGGPHR